MLSAALKVIEFINFCMGSCASAKGAAAALLMKAPKAMNIPATMADTKYPSGFFLNKFVFALAALQTASNAS